MSTITLRFFRSNGTRSGIGISHQSTSPFCSAAAAVAGSGHHDPFDAVEQHPLAAREP